MPFSLCKITLNALLISTLRSGMSVAHAAKHTHKKTAVSEKKLGHQFMRCAALSQASLKMAHESEASSETITHFEKLTLALSKQAQQRLPSEADKQEVYQAIRSEMQNLKEEQQISQFFEKQGAICEKLVARYKNQLGL